MRQIMLYLVSMTGLACGSPSPATSRSPKTVASTQASESARPARVYLFESRVMRGDGQMVRSGSTLLRAGEREASVEIGDACDRYRAEASPTDRRLTSFAVTIGGCQGEQVHLSTRLRLEDGVRVVLGEGTSKGRTEGVLVTVTAFPSEDAMRRALAKRLSEMK